MILIESDGHFEDLFHDPDTDWRDTNLHPELEEINNWFVTTMWDDDDKLVYADKHHRNPDIAHWDMSHVKLINGLLSGMPDFDKDVSGWDLSSVEEIDLFHNDLYLVKTPRLNIRADALRFISRSYSWCDGIKSIRFEAKAVMDIQKCFLAGSPAADRPGWSGPSSRAGSLSAVDRG